MGRYDQTDFEWGGTMAYDGEVQMIDTAVVRLHQQGGRQKGGRSMSGPFQLRPHHQAHGRPGQRHRERQRPDRTSRVRLHAARRQAVRRQREAVAAKKAGANIPPKANRKDPICFSMPLYKARNFVERFFNKVCPRTLPEDQTVQIHRRPISQARGKLRRSPQARRRPHLGQGFMSRHPSTQQA